MAMVGRMNALSVVKEVDFGVYLDGGADHGEILLPKRFVPEGTQVGDTLEVFVYFDSEDQIIATTETPLAQVGEVALLKVVDTSKVGAFADWGLSKDLLIPFSEQRTELVAGRSYLVRIYRDQASGRLVGSTKLQRHIDKTPHNYQRGDEVSLMIAEMTPLGFKAIINHNHYGLLFKSDSFGKLHIGKTLKGYIGQIREDGKISLSLQKPGMAKVDDMSARILKLMEKKGGSLPIGDKSSPEEIHALLRTSKGTFKKAIGGLYKQGLIELDANEIRLK